MIKTFFKLVFIFLAIVTMQSCQKSSTPTPVVVSKPKVGTQWTYRYLTYYPAGGLANNITLVMRIKGEVTLGGETWFNVVNNATDTTMFYLKEKTGGLYQYANSSSNLLCKYPAVLNDTYSSFNAGSMEDFTVKGVNDLLATGIGDVLTHFYEGVKGGFLIDKIWYNNNAWIVRHEVYRLIPPPSNTYYRYSNLFLDAIIY